MKNFIINKINRNLVSSIYHSYYLNLYFNSNLWKVQELIQELISKHNVEIWNVWHGNMKISIPCLEIVVRKLLRKILNLENLHTTLSHHFLIICQLLFFTRQHFVLLLLVLTFSCTSSSTSNEQIYDHIFSSLITHFHVATR